MQGLVMWRLCVLGAVSELWIASGCYDNWMELIEVIIKHNF
jgi:hypothetical protein